VLRSPFDVVALWAAHQQEDDWPAVDIDRPCAALVLRDAADEVLVIGLDPACADFVAALVAGATLAEALARAPGLDLVATLALLLRHGAITGWAAPGDPS
jgi:Na+(H+)/acetate symporter ActP